MTDLGWLYSIEVRNPRRTTATATDLERVTKALRVAIGALESATIALADESPADTVVRIAARARATLAEIERMGGSE